MDVGFLHLSLPFQAQVELELPAKQSLLFLFSEKKSKLNERMTEEKNLIPLRTSLPGFTSSYDVVGADFQIRIYNASTTNNGSVDSF